MDDTPITLDEWDALARQAAGEPKMMLSPEDQARVRAALAAIAGVSSDFMTSENHHPGYVLIPTAKFEQLRAADPAPPSRAPARGSAEPPPAGGGL